MKKLTFFLGCFSGQMEWKVAYHYLKASENYEMKWVKKKYGNHCATDKDAGRKRVSKREIVGAIVNIHKSFCIQVYVCKGFCLQSGHLVSINLYVRPKWQYKSDFFYLAWCMENMNFKTKKWQSKVFLDEKKFCLNGPNKLVYFWHNMRREEKLFSNRQMGGEFLIDCTCLLYHKHDPVVFLYGRTDAVKYCNVL